MVLIGIGFNPISRTRLIVPTIAFIHAHSFLYFLNRNKAGIWGWRTDKTEVVNGFESKVGIWHIFTLFTACQYYCTQPVLVGRLA